LDPILKFDIDRETTQILPNPLKLVVMQLINHEDPHASPQNPRLGAVYLNLAKYINQGNVERRYLLKESKTNATLKVF
jgi:N-terminal C2 in EEIG1 and EHBP1 proteins